MLAGFLTAFEAMASLTLLFALGYGLARKGWMTTEVELFLPRFLTTIVIPPYLAGNILTQFRHDNFLQLLSASLVPAASIVISAVVFYAIALLVRVDRSHRMVFVVGTTASNTLFIGIPVNLALFGDPALPHVLLYFFANTTFFWCVGSYLLALEGEGGSNRHSFATSLRRIFSPPMCGVLVGVVLLLAGIPMPRVILNACGYLGNLATPLALIFLGGTLHRIDWKNAHMGKDIVTGVFCRLALGPLFVVVLLPLVHLPGEMAQVFIIQSGLPTVASLSVLTAYYGADKQYASLLVATSTIVGMLTVPVWMGIISGG